MRRLLRITCNREDGLIFAQINGSILAILLGLFSAYYIYLFSMFDSMQFQIIKEATKINSVQGFIAGENEHEFSEVAHWKYSQEDYIFLLKKLFSLSSEGDSDVSSFDRIKKGKEALFNISRISSHYPFPPMYDEVTGMGASTGQPLIFENILEIEEWLSKIYTAVETILVLYSEEPSSKLKSNIQEYIKTTKNPELLNEVFHRFLSDMQSNRDVLKSIDLQLSHYKLYRKRHPSKSIFIVYFLAAMITFFISVIFPMFKNSTPLFIVIGIPVLFYCLSFILIFIQIAKL